MKITYTDIYRFTIPMMPFAIATGTMDSAQNVFIRVFTDEGIFGVGECSAFPVITGETQDTCLVMAKEFARILKDKDPQDIAGCMASLHMFTAHNSTIKSAFDMALYDISAKAQAVPLYQMLGGVKRNIETDITIGISDADFMVYLAKEFVSKGANILKVKLGKDVKEDVDRIAKIRYAVGEKIEIRIDANQGWNFEQAKEVLSALSTFNIEFCEQPMRSWYDDYLPALIKASPIKIMADESCFNHHDARRLIINKSCDAINIKLSKAGGILEALEIYKTANTVHVPCMVGGMLESRIALSAKLHFAYACKDINYFDLDTFMLGHLKDPCVGGVKYQGYHLDIDDTPGIGADADEAFLSSCEKFTV